MRLRAAILAFCAALGAGARSRPPPGLFIASPPDRAQLPHGDVTVRLAPRAAGRAHAHLIVDSGPALEVPDLSEPVVLQDLKPGPHSVRAVLCNARHLAFHQDAALALVRFWVGPPPDDEGRASAAEAAAWPDPKKPLLTLVSPRGDPEGDPPLLDFHVKNAQLGPRAYKVRIVVDKREYPLAKDEKPVKLKKLRKGAHKISIDLLDRRANKVSKLNRTDRSFVTK